MGTMSPNIPQTYIIYSNVTGKPATEVEFIERLKHFSSSALLRVCSVLNMVLTQWVDGYDEDSHARLVRTFFHPTLANALLATGRPVFHRHQLLFVAQEALRHCEATHESPVTLPEAKEAGILLLMASELLASPPLRRSVASEELARRISSILPDMETNGPSTYHRKDSKEGVGGNLQSSGCRPNFPEPEFLPRVAQDRRQARHRLLVVASTR